MELPMPLETNGNQLPVTQNCSDANGRATNSHASDDSSVIPVNQHTPERAADTPYDAMIPNGGTVDFHPSKLKAHDDKTLQDTHHSHLGGAKTGTSSPTEHKQHLHLPLRKRHLLASTGTHNNEAPLDSNHTATAPTTTMTNTQEHESDLAPTTGIHSTVPIETTAIEPHHTTLIAPTEKTIDSTPTEHPEPPEPPEPTDSTELQPKPTLDNTELPNLESTTTESKLPSVDSYPTVKVGFKREQSREQEHTDDRESESHSLKQEQSETQNSSKAPQPSTSPSSPLLHQIHHSRIQPQVPHTHQPQPAQQHPHHPLHHSSHNSSHHSSQHSPQHSPQHSSRHAPHHSSQHSSHHSAQLPSHSSQHSQQSHHQLSHNQHGQHAKPTQTQLTVSPSTTHSPTRTHSPTQLPSNARHSSSSSSTSRGRGSGRGRGRSNKAEGSSSSTSSGNTSGGEELYCFCRRPYDPTVDVFMICCDACDEWYHGSCVGVNQREAKKIARYVCPRCKKIPTSPTTTSATSSEVSSEDEPNTPPPSRTKKRKTETTFKTEPKRQAVSPSISDNGVDSPTQGEERYCLNCNKQAQPKSKYCGQECGLEYARKQYNSGKKAVSATELADKETLDEIAKKKADTVGKLTRLDKEQRKLEKAIQFARNMDSSPSSPRPTSPINSPPLLDNSPPSDKLTSPNEPTMKIQPTAPTFSFSSSDNNSSSSTTNNNTTMDCVSCGHPIAVSKYTLHMERCYHKKESNVLMVGATADGGTVFCNVYDSKSKTFCKKLRHACTVHATKRGTGGVGVGAAGIGNGNPSFSAPSANSNGGGGSGSGDGGGGVGGGVGNGFNGNNRRSLPPQTCGCPTSDFQSGYCELTRKSCVKHYNWEEVMRDSISNQRTQHNKILAGLEADENAVRLRMSRRNQSATNSHRTIVEA